MNIYDIYINKELKRKSVRAKEPDITPPTAEDTIIGMEAFPINSLLLNSMSFGMEADSPFGDIGTGDDFDTEQEGSSDDFSSDESENDPFADTGDGGVFDDMDDGDSFGDSDSSEKEKPQVIDRIESIKSKFDMSKVIRKNFPANIKVLRDIAEASINLMEQKVVSGKHEELRNTIIQNYRDIYNIITQYIDIIHNETHEGIFIKYVEFWTLMNKQKMLSDKIDE